MTVSPQIIPQVVDNAYRRNIRAADLRSNDLEPVCPRCYEIAAFDSVVCIECGARLTENPPMVGRHGAWRKSA